MKKIWVLMMATILMLASDGPAATIYWDGSGTSWNSVTSWSTDAAGTIDPLAVPGASDDVIFSIPSLVPDQTISLSANQAANSLYFSNVGTIDLLGGGRTLTLGSGGITVDAAAAAVTLGNSGSSVGLRVSTTQSWINNSGNTLTIRNASSATNISPATLTLGTTGAGGITFVGSLSESGAALNVVVASTGAGAVSMLGGSWTGTTTVQSGTLTYTGLPTGGGNILIGDSSGSLASTLNLNSSGSIINNITVQSGSSGTSTLASSSTVTASGTLTLNKNLNVGGSGALTLSGVVSGTGNLNKTGSSSVVLSGSNTYTGATGVSAGTLSVASFNSVSGGGASSSLGAPVTVANGTIALGNGTTGVALVYTGSGETTDRVLDLAGTTGTVTLDQSGTGLLKFTSNLTATGNGNKTITLQGSSAGKGEISGVIPSSTGTTAVTKTGSGTWTLSGLNTYTGITSITGGVLEITKLAAGGSASSIGQSSNAATSLVITNGTLRYVGSGDSTDRRFTIGNNVAGATLDASGTGAIQLTNTTSPTQTTAATSRTLTLTGTNTGNNTLAANLANAGTGITSLLKDGAGTWVLSGTTTYTGTTTVNGGTLLVNGSLAAGSAVSVNTGALGGSGTVNGLVTTAGTASVISPGTSPGTLTLAGGLNAAAGATFVFELGTSSDLLNLGSGVLTGSSSAGGLHFNFANSGGLATGNPYTLMTFGSASGLDYTDLIASVLPAGFALDSAYGTNGFQINGTNLQVQFAAVPEPSTCALLGLGLASLYFLRRKRLNERAE